VTTRTAWPDSPATLARTFVSAAHGALRRTLAIHGIEPVKQMRFTAVCGAGFWLSCDGHSLRGEDYTTNVSAQRLTKCCAAELSLGQRARVMQFIDCREQAPDVEPGHFEVRCDFDGPDWRLAVRACARGSALQIAVLEGEVALLQAIAA
jgi:hypothetical protein